MDLDCRLSNIIPKKKETKYHLRNKRAHHPEIKTDRFKNVFVNRLIFLDTIFDLSNICIQYVIRLFRLPTADVTEDMSFYLNRRNLTLVTQRYNTVVTLFRMAEILFQHLNPVLR